MKKIMEFSEKKFSSFSYKKQIRIIVSFIEAIVQRWDDREERERLRTNLKACLSSLNDAETDAISEVKGFRQKISSAAKLDSFLILTSSIRERYGKTPDDAELIVPSEKTAETEPVLPLIVALDNLRSAFNVGSIIRTSECLRVKKIYMCGYTPTPINRNVLKTSLNAEMLVDWEKANSCSGLIMKLRREEINLKVVALETGENSESIHQFEFTEPIMLIVGNEIDGVSPEVLSLVDHKVAIPLSGRKDSFNVGVAFGIACYEIGRQWK